MNLKPWRENSVPHANVSAGTLQQSEFAADLSRVHEGTASAEYQDPVLFFQRTFITEGMRLLLGSVVKRLAGKGGDPVIQLQTAFGGGKTHTMLAVYHLAKGEAYPGDLQGIPPILDEIGVVDMPRARMVVLDGISSSPNQPVVREGQAICTLWGDLAWQLGKADAYAMVAAADASGTSPGKAVLEALLKRYAPCVILVDELVAYVRQFEDSKTLTGGTFDSNLSFVQALTEALKAVPTAVMLASLPVSEGEAGSERGARALDALSRSFGRVQALWKPVATREAFEIVRRRLFSTIIDPVMAESVCRAFADYYAANGHDFPRDAQQPAYFDRLIQAYPIHPEVFDRLYDDWSSLETFQRTRGVLKLMAMVIYRLWDENDKDLLIMPGSFPLKDGSVRDDLLYHLPDGWNPVLERDVDGDRAETTEIDNTDARLGSVQACRRSARAIFLGSAPSTANQMVRGIELERVILGVAQPGQQIALFKDALSRLGDRLQYLNSGNNRFWFDTRPNLRREMEDRKRRFHEHDQVFPAIQAQLRKLISNGVFGGVHLFMSSADIADDEHLRLVVLPPDAAFSRSDDIDLARRRASEIVKNRGDKGRQNRNRLIFLCADYDSVSRLKDHARSVLAWRSIVDDIREEKIILDQLQARHAKASFDNADESLRKMIRETYKWLLVPMERAGVGKGSTDIQWESCSTNSGNGSYSQEIERVLKDREWLISQWAPIHLAAELKKWFWKDGSDASAIDVWRQTCARLYMPRLESKIVFLHTIEAGTDTRDFFGIAQGKEDERYIGFAFGKAALISLDESLILIEPITAARWESEIKPSAPAETTSRNGNDEMPGETPGGRPAIPPVAGATPLQPKRFFGSVEVRSNAAVMDFTKVVDEVLNHLNRTSDAKVTIMIEVEASSPTGFGESVERTVKENCNTLNFRQAGFESVD